MNARYYTQLRKGVAKLVYYVTNFMTYVVPSFCYRILYRKVANIPSKYKEEVQARVAYYNRMPRCVPMDNWMEISGYKYPFGQKDKHTNYFFDLFKVVRYFPAHLRFAYEFGDVTEEPIVPAFVKSRPVSEPHLTSTAVLLKLNAVRHFHFVPDSRPFRNKANRLVSRNVVRQPQRQLFLEKCFGHPLCDVGQINSDTVAGHPEWVKPYLTPQEQLANKFIACIEGNDVATNLKWVMASNSLAVMPRPRFETWFMEGTLIPNYHYVEVASDYSDLFERLQYYIDHPEEAETIIHHAHEYVARFRDKKLERLVALQVAATYFERSGQTFS